MLFAAWRLRLRRLLRFGDFNGRAGNQRIRRINDQTFIRIQPGDHFERIAEIAAHLERNKHAPGRRAPPRPADPRTGTAPY